jgi:hypothetical protein
MKGRWFTPSFLILASVTVTRVIASQPDLDRLLGSWRIDVGATTMPVGRGEPVATGSEDFAQDYFAVFTLTFKQSGDRTTLTVDPDGSTIPVRVEAGVPGRLTVTPLDPQGGAEPLVIRFVDENHFIAASGAEQSEVQYRRVFNPEGVITGIWSAVKSPVLGQAGAVTKPADEDADELRIVVGPTGDATISLPGESWSGRLQRPVGPDRQSYRFERQGGEGPSVELQLKERGEAVAVIGGREWVVRRSDLPKDLLAGYWTLDIAALRDMPWIKRLAPDDREERIAELAESVQHYSVYGEVGTDAERQLKPAGDGRYAVYEFGELSHFVRIVEANRIVIEAGYGPEYPLVREEPGQGSKTTH